LTLIACVPLFSVLIMLLIRGGSRIIHSGLTMFTSLPPGAMAKMGEGGFSNALWGTLVMVGLAALLSVPFGILGAIFLAEYSPASRLSTAVRFAAKVLTGLPSILAGVFAYAAVVIPDGPFARGAGVLFRLLPHPAAALPGAPASMYFQLYENLGAVSKGGFSAIAGAIALSVLMIPIVILTAEQALRMVPSKMKQAAVGMGCTKAQVTWKVVVPTALPGILTGVMLAIARAAGETAPLIFTALASDYLFPVDGHPPFVHLMRQTASMAVFIFNGSARPQANLIELAWAASLVLVLLVLVFNIGGQLLSRSSRPRGR